MTEEEAKQKWCCQVNADAKCIGSACMAWRQEWHFKGHPDGTFDTLPTANGHGYCGLAGKP